MSLSLAMRTCVCVGVVEYVLLVHVRVGFSLRFAPVSAFPPRVSDV